MITIGIPVTKVRFLEQTLASVVRQRLQDFEVVVVDNGADGDVEALVRKFAFKNLNFQKNSSRIPPIPNWNKVLSLATRPWFILLSDDDYFEPDHLECLLNAVRPYPQVRVAHSRVRLVDEAGVVGLLTPTAPSWESALDLLWHRVYHYRIQFLSDFMFNTASLKANEGFIEFPSAWGSDDATCLREAAYGGVAYSSAATLNYRLNPFNLSSTASIHNKTVAVQLYATWVRNFLEGMSVSGRDLEIKSQILSRLPSYTAIQTSQAVADTGVYNTLKLLPRVIFTPRQTGVSMGTWLRAFDAAAHKRLRRTFKAKPTAEGSK